MLKLSLIADLNMGEWGWNFPVLHQRIHEEKGVEDPSDSKRRYFRKFCAKMFHTRLLDKLGGFYFAYFKGKSLDL